jgi:hypothetical protein
VKQEADVPIEEMRRERGRERDRETKRRVLLELNWLSCLSSFTLSQQSAAIYLGTCNSLPFLSSGKEYNPKAPTPCTIPCMTLSDTLSTGEIMSGSSRFSATKLQQTLWGGMRGILGPYLGTYIYLCAHCTRYVCLTLGNAVC